LSYKKQNKAPTAKIGKAFEFLIETILELKGFTVLRIPDGCRQVSAFKIIRTKSPFDFIAHKKGECIYFDAKTTEGKTFPYSLVNHVQVKHLASLQESGFRAGYIIEYRETAEIVFASAKKLLNLVPGKSLKPPDCEPL